MSSFKMSQIVEKKILEILAGNGEIAPKEPSTKKEKNRCKIVSIRTKLF